jgi:hypothetical protein
MTTRPARVVWMSSPSQRRYGRGSSRRRPCPLAHGLEQVVGNLPLGFFRGPAVELLRAAVPVDDADPDPPNEDRIVALVEEARLCQKPRFGALSGEHAELSQHGGSAGDSLSLPAPALRSGGPVRALPSYTWPESVGGAGAHVKEARPPITGARHPRPRLPPCSRPPGCKHYPGLVNQQPTRLGHGTSSPSSPPST